MTARDRERLTGRVQTEGFEGDLMEGMATRSARRGARFSCALLVLALLCGCVTTTPGAGPRSDEDQADAKLNLGLDYLSQGRTALAIRELKLASELDPKNGEVLLWLGEGYRRKGRLEEAQMYMEQALVASPDSHLVRLNLSGLYIQLERYEDAIAQADALMEDATFPTPWEALNNRGWAELQNGSFASAEASFEEALEYHPRYWPSRLNLGILASERGRKREAVEHFNEVLERGPDAFALAEANYRIGEVYISWGESQKAIGHFQQALDESPNSRWGEQSRGYLELLE
jgi:type IV pilus biogenesis/stability protein PilW